MTRLTEDHCRDRVLHVLDEITDPCSVRAGLPAGLVTMGLVRHLELRETESGVADVDVTIAVTEPTCLMGWPFARAATERLEALPQIGLVTVRLDNATQWTPDDLDPSYRAALAQRGQEALPH